MLGKEYHCTVSVFQEKLFLYSVLLFRETYVFETAILTKVANFDFDSIDYLFNSYIFKIVY